MLSFQMSPEIKNHSLKPTLLQEFATQEEFSSLLPSLQPREEITGLEFQQNSLGFQITSPRELLGQTFTNNHQIKIHLLLLAEGPASQPAEVLQVTWTDPKKPSPLQKTTIPPEKLTQAISWLKNRSPQEKI